ncbi:dihydrofolate reductase family protein [Leucobacter tardus]|uniref:Dihydrofolate reductase family protein n=1 Tax=Leucobacter tardus TaxID=501483 RepID=A0A939QDL6_9MICO|nr:dihydrofolate reductase family protein [Leucobacter tardus]MBO2990212.1 dihydrofolate reductase family protein [Leucobacter tardus]
MRPLRYSINVTLDGCVDHTAIEPNTDMHEHAEATIARADALLFGRVTYQLMERAWRPPASDTMPGWTQPFARTIDRARKHVVSNTLDGVDWNASLISGDESHIINAVRALKAEPGNGIYVGGVTLPTLLAAAGLIDEFEFIVHPRLAGHGPTLFAGLPEPLDLEPTDRTAFTSGAVATRYVPRR